MEKSHVLGGNLMD